jgi:alpha-mannosidase
MQRAATILLLTFLPILAGIAPCAAAEAAAGKPVLPGVDPSRSWEIFLVQHTHTDIGYTAVQPEILRDHLRFIDEAVRMARETDGFPEEARFKWTCEVTLGVEEYLRNRPPEAVKAFLEEVRRGRIEVAGLPVNLTDLASEDVLVRALQAVRELRALGIPIRAAMQCDTNGYPWALPRLFAEAGIRWFASASNETRSRIPFAAPTAFTWESPDGSSVLAFRGEHYHVANILGLATSLEEAEKKIPRALEDQGKAGYPHDVILFQISGYYSDNSPPSTRPCEIVRAWNAKWGNPRLRTATLSEWFEALEARAKAKPERRRIAWPDWWADGNGSAPLEVAEVREAQERLLAAEALATAGGAGLGEAGREWRERARRANRSALLFDEHTFGASSSVGDPGGLAAKTQSGFKSSFAFEAAAEATALEDAAMASALRPIGLRGRPTMAIVNPTAWDRSEVVRAAIPEWALPGSAATARFRLVDHATGSAVPMQLLARGQSEVAVLVETRNVSSLGYRLLRIEAEEPPQAFENPFRFEGTSLASDLIEVKVSAATGAIESLRDRASGAEFAGAAGAYGLGTVVHEKIIDPRKRDALWPIRPDPKFDRATAKEVKVERGLQGPLVASLRVSGKAGDIDFIEEISLYRGERRVDLTVTLRKPGRAEPEAAYIAFPFRFEAPEVRAEAAGGVFRPGIDQVPGMATDWHSVQRWVRLSEGSRGIAWATVDAPLVQFGDINTGRYLETLPPRRPAFFSWALNNYWFTNFPAVQGGEFRFRYSLLPFPEGPGSDSEASRFARARSLPLRAVVVPPRAADAPEPPPSAGLLRVGSRRETRLTATALKPAGDGRGAILRIVEEEGVEAEAQVSFHRLLRVDRAERCNFLEEKVGDLEVKKGEALRMVVPVKLRPYETAHIRLEPFQLRTEPSGR